MPSLNLSTVSLSSKSTQSSSATSSPISTMSDTSSKYAISLPPSYSQISLTPSQVEAQKADYAEMLEDDNMSWGKPSKLSKSSKSRK
ncbi:hypothetical protein NEOLEDRAFT_1179780 [Neolentinus lepideus HHB14362 ss-1]|uniref:Uncharacterized protein n=1 Tax=Neolentinus lepideus HHB14362 ss-1 TaxID=1314782 RepID=A0A165RGP5_9AGAM|nr:hypothetical protein NEOLEDRAFT_1179780 [Neolentinus lepideus HHB14362 ss-1]